MKKQEEQKFSCEFSARIGEQRVSKKYVVRARDSYHATDLIKEKIGARYHLMTNPVFKFGAKKFELSRAAVRVATAGLASPEEQ